MKNNIPDIQNKEDSREIPIQKVGIKSLKYPIKLSQKDNDSQFQPSIGVFDMFVSLPANKKGTHMSRFIQIIENLDVINESSLLSLLDEITDKLNSKDAFVKIETPFFVNKEAPISKIKSLMDYQLIFRANKKGNKKEVWTEILVPVTSLCPCSKEISKYGAHNQRSHLIVNILQKKHTAFEDLIKIIEQQGACEVYSTLKRPDEKYITEKAYENPKFVEDIVRDLAIQMDKNPNILAYKVSSENFESIHNHSAYGFIENDKRK